MCSAVNNNLPVQYNSIDMVFSGCNGGDSLIINQGMLKGYGTDNDITYLVSRIDNDTEISVERNGDHLTWKVGNKEITLGSSLWVRLVKFVHEVKKYCSAYYATTFELSLIPQIDKIRKAYAACLDKENQEKLVAKKSDLELLNLSIDSMSVQLEKNNESRRELLERKEGAENIVKILNSWLISDEDKVVIRRFDNTYLSTKLTKEEKLEDLNGLITRLENEIEKLNVTIDTRENLISKYRDDDCERFNREISELQALLPKQAVKLNNLNMI
jgi:hypothetical protein